MTEKKNLLFISNLYPNKLDPNIASFNRQQILALSEYFNVVVVAPVAWQIKLKKRPFPSHYKLGLVSSCHPTYFYTPGILRNLYGHFFYLSIQSCVNKLLKEKNYQAIYGSWLYPDGWACANLAKQLGLPLFLKVHGTDVNQLQPESSITERSLWAVSQAKAVFCVSHALRNRLIDLGACADKLHVVYNGVDIEAFHPEDKIETRISLGLPLHEKIILFVGNLLETKGLAELADAFGVLVQNRRDLRLVVVGTGVWEKNFREKINLLNCAGKVELVGSVKHSVVGKYMNATDILCLPSHMEGTPNVILEALATNTPVVASAVGGIPALAAIDERVTLAQPKNADSLQKAIMRSLDSPSIGGNILDVKSWHENAAEVVGIINQE